MRGEVLVVHGDITALSAHAVAYSTDRGLSEGGQLTAAFEAHVAGFLEGYAALRHATRQRKPDAGDAFWLPASETGRPHGVVVTVAAAGSGTRAERAYLATRGALQCACAELERAAIPRPWTVALPCFLAGDGGARHDRVTVAEPQLEAAHAFVAEQRDVDVAFIAYTEANYQVWLEARRRVRARTGWQPAAPEPDESLVAAITRGECVLFLGSGLSSGSGLPGWGALIDALADDLALGPEHRRADLEYLLDLAQWYRNDGLRPTVEERVARLYAARTAGARPTIAQYLLASLPVRYFVTTNYDDLLETALAGLRRHPLRVVSERDVARTGSPDGCYVVKFHGCAASGTDVVLSRDDYDDFFRARPAMALLLEGLLLNQSFFFVGYGLRDPDFRQIWARIGAMLRDAKRPAFAATFDTPPRHGAVQWLRQGLSIQDIRGDDLADKSRALDRFLDRLAENVSRDGHLLLADDVDAFSAELEAVRDGLLRVVPDLVDACARSLRASRTEVLALADLLRFYAAHGWRGSTSGHLGALFGALSLHPALSAEERRDLLVSALRHTESAEDAQRIESILAHRDESTR
jgi:O-acetyl-ADP-ribose deacetylase (regulator of RNase III)